MKPSYKDAFGKLLARFAQMTYKGVHFICFLIMFLVYLVVHVNYCCLTVTDIEIQDRLCLLSRCVPLEAI